MALIFRKAKYKFVELQGCSVSEKAMIRQKNHQKQQPRQWFTSNQTLPPSCGANLVHYNATEGAGGEVSIVQVGEGESMGIVVERGGMSALSGLWDISTSSGSYSGSNNIVSVEVAPT